MTLRSYLDNGLPRSRSISRVERALGSLTADTLLATLTSGVVLFGRDASFDVTQGKRDVWRVVTRPGSITKNEMKKNERLFASRVEWVDIAVFLLTKKLRLKSKLQK